MQTIISLAALAGLAASLSPAAIQFRHEQIEDELGIGYAVLCEDVDADGDADIVALNETQVIWWSNPGWEKHVVLDGETEADNVAPSPPTTLPGTASWSSRSARLGGPATRRAAERCSGSSERTIPMRSGNCTR